MSELVPTMLSLDKGLDLQTAKIIAPPGSVLDSLNYEQVDFQGQKRIEGYARYDGTALPALDEYYDLTVEDSTDVVSGSVLRYQGKVFGSVAVVEDNVVRYTRLDSTVILPTSATVDVVSKGVDAAVLTSVSVVSDVAGKDSGATAEAHYVNLLAAMDSLRSNVEHLPGPIAGLHWFQDRLYAVAGLQKFTYSAPVTPTDPTITMSMHYMDRQLPTSDAELYPISFSRMIYPTTLRMEFTVPTNGAMDGKEFKFIDVSGTAQLQVPFGVAGGTSLDPNQIYTWNKPDWIEWDLLTEGSQPPTVAPRPFAEQFGPPPMRFKFKDGTPAGTYVHELPILVMASPSPGLYPLRVEVDYNGQTIADELTMEVRTFVPPALSISATPSSGVEGTPIRVTLRIEVDSPYMGNEIEEWTATLNTAESISNITFPFAGMQHEQSGGTHRFTGVPVNLSPGTYEISFDSQIAAGSGYTYDIQTAMAWRNFGSLSSPATTTIQVL